MRAVQFTEQGGPEVLRIATVPDPHAGAGRIRVAVRAAGVNPFDWKFRSGRYPAKEFPQRVGLEAAGVVDEVGPEVDGVAVGDEVFGLADGGAIADYALLRYWARKPASMSWAQAGGLAISSETATRLLIELGVRDGSVLVVNGASGGVGSATVQLAVARGATVIGVAGTANHDYLRSIGAIPVAYGDGLVERVRRTAPTGRVDLAADISGNGVIPELIEITGVPQNVVSIADFSATGLGARTTSGQTPETFRGLQTVAELFDEGRYQVEVQQVFGLTEVGAAQELSRTGHVRGKLIVAP
jgi:NADPH:quinone reductase-like Zn-dependent oxidoreductase